MRRLITTLLSAAASIALLARRIRKKRCRHAAMQPASYGFPLYSVMDAPLEEYAASNPRCASWRPDSSFAQAAHHVGGWTRRRYSTSPPSLQMAPESSREPQQPRRRRGRIPPSWPTRASHVMPNRRVSIHASPDSGGVMSFTHVVFPSLRSALMSRSWAPLPAAILSSVSSPRRPT